MKRSTKTGLVVTGLIMIAGLAAWGYQYKEGLVVTNMRNSYSWGLYVSGLAFFVGNAAGGLVLSSLIYLFGVKSLKPFAKLGALTAFANVTAAMLAILPDIGYPLRLYQMILNPQLMSPLIWDVAILNLYAVLSLLYLYLLMLPDFKGPLQKIALRVKDPAAFSERWAKRLAPFTLVAAVGIHVITAWVFSTQGARDWWHSAALAPDFISVAISSGTALVLLVSVIAYGGRERFQEAYRTMALFISAAFFIHLFLMYNDFFIHTWYGANDALEPLSVLFREFGSAHAFEVAAPLASVVLLLNSRVRKSAAAVTACCSLFILGVFMHRFLLMPGAFQRVPLTMTPMGLQDMQWSVPIASGVYDPSLDTFVTEWHYFPSGVEIVIFLGVLAYMCFLLLLAADRLPVVGEVKS
ncbi:MAG: molybdopterin oxidoreductase [Desulfobacteraceae bacterium]|nr:MAG: molybdopterin oxidoreductase [Desulfobacteraceae bacterium]